MSVSHQIPVAGALYAYLDSDGTYKIMKILAVDNLAVHVRIYVERFSELPAQVSSSQLSLGISDSGFGIGHAPLSLKGFGQGLTLVGLEEVQEKELDGYRIWAGLDPA